MFTITRDITKRVSLVTYNRWRRLRDHVTVCSLVGYNIYAQDNKNRDIIVPSLPTDAIAKFSGASTEFDKEMQQH